MQTTIKKIVIDSEISKLSPPLHPNEEAKLEESLSRHGCYDAVTVYRNQANELILLDGHRRLQICQKNGLTYSTREIEIKSQEAALVWVS